MTSFQVNSSKSMDQVPFLSQNIFFILHLQHFLVQDLLHSGGFLHLTEISLHLPSNPGIKSLYHNAWPTLTLYLCITCVAYLPLNSVLQTNAMHAWPALSKVFLLW